MKARFNLCIFILFHLQIQLFLISKGKCVADSEVDENIRSCENRNFIITSTLDGVVTALDMITGEKCWSVLLDPEKFFSSSLHELQIYENDRRVWLVPSLDGYLYKYDSFKQVIQSLPIDVDSFLSLYMDASTSIIGGKIKILFGIDRLTGEILYTCKVDGCNKTFKTEFPQNVLIIEEIVQLVNAIDSSKIQQKWHFRVSELKVKIPLQIHSENPPVFNDSKQSNALVLRDNMEFVDISAYKLSLQNGFAGMINKTTNDFAWVFKASCPITDAWYVKDNTVIVLDPFARESGFFSIQMDDGVALLFLGLFENQMFIKKSKKLLREEMNLTSLSTSVLHQTYTHAELAPVCPKVEYDISLPITISSTDDFLHSFNWDLSDYGSYFYLNYSVAENRTHCIINASYIVKYDKSQLSYQFLLLYILASIITLLVLFIIFGIIAYKVFNKQYVDSSTSSTEITGGIIADLEFRSRFDQDFEFLSVLGKGGFGVVMDVKNKIDDCRYAVKRIHLHEKLNKIHYEKVLREVKALAKLDHHGIVRYFNAWTEYPPLGWQEQKDEQYFIRASDYSEESCLEYSGTPICEISTPKKKLVSFSKIKEKINRNPLLLDDLLAVDEKYMSDEHSFSSSSYKNPFELFDSQHQMSCSHFETEQSYHSETEKSYDSEIEQNYQYETDQICQYQTLYSSHSEIEQSSSDEDSNLNEDDLNFPFESEQTSHDSCCSIVFEDSKKNLSDEVSVLHKENLKSFHESSPNRSSIKEDDSQTKFPADHVECYTILRNLNDKLTSCKLNLEVFDMFCAYFFNKESVSGIPVTERSDWDKIVNEVGIVNKLDFQQWLICILCLIQASTHFICSLVVNNLCCILCDFVNKDHNFGKGSTYALSKREGIVISSQKESEKKKVIVTPVVREKGLVHKSKSREKFGKEVPRGYLYIQMQLCRKESLRDWLDCNHDNREYSTVMEIFSQIVDAVHYVHNCGLMHRDLKPSNIYFSLEGAIKVGDFGLATSSEIHEANITNSKQSHDRTTDIGTEIYMSPEQKLSEDYDCKTDIYSLGIILLELLVPFKTTLERYKVLLHLRKYVFPEEFEEKYKQEKELVMHLMHNDPEKRPSTHEIKQHILLLKYTPESKLMKK